MRFPLSLSVSIPLVAIGILAGCQSEAPTAGPGPNGSRAGADARQQAYVRELLALKAAVPDQKNLEARHLGLLAKYGYPLPEEESAPAAAALAKAAAVNEVLVKQTAGSIYRTYRKWVTVPKGQRISIYVLGQDATDPFVVAYLGSSDQNIHYVIANDDSSAGKSLNSNGSWLNGTGSDQVVTYTVFAALNTARGLADVYVKVGANAWTSAIGVRVGGTVQYQNDFTGTPGSGCASEPSNSRFDFKVNSGSNSVRLLAFNDAQAAGIEASAGAAGANLNSPWIPSGTQKDAGANRHFVMASYASPTFGSQTISGGFTYSQYDDYSCP